MKKILCILMAITLMFMPVVSCLADEADKNTKEPINIYVFYAEWCGNCTNLHAMLKELKEDKEYGPMFKVIDYRVDNEASYGANPNYEENSELMSKVADYLNADGEHIPLLIIGDKDFTGFSTEKSPALIQEAIKNAYESDDYVDVVDGLINNSLKEKKKTGLTDDQIGYIILGIAAVVIIGIIVARSSNKYYDDTEEIAETPKKEEKIVELEQSNEKQQEEKTKEEDKDNTKKTNATKNNTTKKASTGNKKASTTKKTTTKNTKKTTSTKKNSTNTKKK